VFTIKFKKKQIAGSSYFKSGIVTFIQSFMAICGPLRQVIIYHFFAFIIGAQ